MRHTATTRTSLILLALTASMPALALDIGVTKGVGTDDFRSTGVDAGVDLFNQAVRADASYYLGESAGEGPDTFNASLRWQASPRISGTMAYRYMVSDITTVLGGDFTLGVGLSTPWTGAHPATLSITYGGQSYQPNAARVLPALRLRVPRQTHVQVALWQQLSAQWSVNASWDRYRYDKDPIDLATAIVVLGLRRHFPITAAYNAIGFSDRIASVGLGWAPNERYTVGLNASQVRGVLDQTSNSVGLNVARTLGRYTVSGNLSHSSSGATRGPNGFQLVPSSTGTYFDLRVGAHF